MISAVKWPSLCGLAFSIVATQAPAAESRLHAADPVAPAAMLEYRSAFADYRKPQFEAKTEWRRANDAVREAGGHAGALQDGADRPAPDHDHAPKAGSGHGGHHGHAGHRQ